MGLFLIIALLIIVSAFYSYINARFIKLPGTIGIVTIAIVVSIITIAVDKFDPDTAQYLTALAKNINFSGTVLNIMLAFLQRDIFFYLRRNGMHHHFVSNIRVKHQRIWVSAMIERV